jgi:hypothetical protein
MRSLLAIVVLLAMPLAARADDVVISPLVVQNAALFLSEDVTAGGVGGGGGVQMLYAHRALLQLDVTALWGLGTALFTRVAAGAQLERGSWAPAAWIGASAFWGDRLEFLSGAAERPNRPSWTLGLRLSPLRFATRTTTISALEPGIGSDFVGGLGLELNVFQMASTF